MFFFSNLISIHFRFSNRCVFFRFLFENYIVSIAIIEYWLVVVTSLCAQWHERKEHNFFLCSHSNRTYRKLTHSLNHFESYWDNWKSKRCLPSTIDCGFHVSRLKKGALDNFGLVFGHWIAFFFLLLLLSRFHWYWLKCLNYVERSNEEKKNNDVEEKTENRNKCRQVETWTEHEKYPIIGVMKSNISGEHNHIRNAHTQRWPWLFSSHYHTSHALNSFENCPFRYPTKRKTMLYRYI